MPWIARGGTIDQDTTAEIERQGDRGAAIMAGSYLEDYFGSAIRAIMVDDKKSINQMFERMGPLATFSAEIEMAYLLKIVEKGDARTMHIIREIRNDFAHDLRPITFDDQSVRDRCKSLCTKDDLIAIRERAIKELRPKLQEIRASTEFLEPFLAHMIALEDTPRNRYLNTIKYLVLILEWGRVRELAKLLQSSVARADPDAGGAAPLMSAPK